MDERLPASEAPISSGAVESWQSCLTGRLVYHATPLHYLPSILSAKALLSKTLLAARGIEPRRTAARRDRMLGLSDYVHLSFEAVTPLLRNKIARGYPHVVLEFDGHAVAWTYGAAILRCNTKVWASRCSLQAEMDVNRINQILRWHFECRRLPSIELLALYAVDLAALTSIIAIGDEQLELIKPVTAMLGYGAELTCMPGTELGGRSESVAPGVREYYQECLLAGAALLPPKFVFD